MAPTTMCLTAGQHEYYKKLNQSSPALYFFMNSEVLCGVAEEDAEQLHAATSDKNVSYPQLLQTFIFCFSVGVFNNCSRCATILVR